MKSKLASLIAIFILAVSCKKSEVTALATITTTAVTAIQINEATSGGDVTSDGGATITERGICFNTAPVPTIANNKVISGNGSGSFSVVMTGLTEGTTYHVRAYAINSEGISYGQEIQFTTEFESVTIGTQVWMKKNLDVAVYQNGDSIPQVSDAAAWGALNSGAWSYYNNDPASGAIYGKLYNSYAVGDSRKIAPAGWHVPTDAEWGALVAFLGGAAVAGDALKEAGTAHWTSPNPGATNSSGFTGYPGGGRGIDGTFIQSGDWGSWLTSSTDPSSTDFVWCYQLYFTSSGVNRAMTLKTVGFSVRCIKD